MGRGNFRFFLVLVVLLLFSAWRSWQTEGFSEGRRPVPDAGEYAGPPDYGAYLGPLPAQSADDPPVSVGLGRKSSSTGTAFALPVDGLWMTARHVADQCDQVQLHIPGRRGRVVRRVVLHHRADLAVLVTGAGRSDLMLARRSLTLGQHGFHVGYPQGEAGEVHSTLLGRRRMRVRGRYRTDEPVVAWVERRRRPSRLSGLGGLSGGPTLDGSGRVVGVMVAASQRRGRVYTAAPVSLRELLGQDIAGVDTGRAIPIDAATMKARADALRKTGQVARVICLVRK